MCHELQIHIADIGSVVTADGDTGLIGRIDDKPASRAWFALCGEVDLQVVAVPCCALDAIRVSIVRLKLMVQ